MAQREMASLQQLLDEEGSHSGKTRNPAVNMKGRIEQEEVFATLPVYLCHDQKGFDSSKQTREFKASMRKVHSALSSRARRSSLVSETSNRKSLLDEPAIDEVAIGGVISVLSGYIGRYIKDASFREMIRDKCLSCLVRRREDSDDGTFSSLEMGMECIERLVQDHRGKDMELRIESLRNSIHLFSIVSSLNSKKSRNNLTAGIPNSHLSACAQLYLSIVYKLEKNHRISAWHLLQVFSDAPFLARTHLLPDLWEHFFLPHLLHLKIWYHKELEYSLNSLHIEKERRMTGLSKVYNDRMDIGTFQFAQYYSKWLKVGAKAPSIPVVPLPSRPIYAKSRRMSSDSYSSHSSVNRDLYQIVFGLTRGHQWTELDTASMGTSSLKEEKMFKEADVCRNCSNATNKVRIRHSSSMKNCPTSKYQSWPETHKLHQLNFFSCHNILSECLLVHGKHIVGNNWTQNDVNTPLPLTDLGRAIRIICSSNNLLKRETAIHAIAKAWLDSQSNSIIEGALSKADVIEGMFKVLLDSDDEEILELSISLLAELVLKNQANRLIILNTDPQLEIFVRLLKSSSMFLKAAVLLYLVKPAAKQMISAEWVALILRVLEFGGQLQTLFTVRCIPHKAAVYLLDQLLTGFNEDRNLENAIQVVSLGGLDLLIRSLDIGAVNERNKAAMLISRCIQAQDSIRNYLVVNLDKSSLLELIALQIQKKSQGYALILLIELLGLSRRTQIIEFLIGLSNGWGGLSTLHIFLIYLQRASPEERPLVAAILLQLDLLASEF
uniref:E3 ubiquitin-protein ligase LIN n=1 Tax=Rhizophora mucronata TaxID=61149 RepID=A0A2P2IJR8_RHIMU